MHLYSLLSIYALYSFALKKIFAFYAVDIFLQTSILYVCYYFRKDGLLKIFFLSSILDLINLNVVGSSFGSFLCAIIIIEKIHLDFLNRHMLSRFCLFNLLGYLSMVLINVVN
jgi:hypothetical protein